MAVRDDRSDVKQTTAGFRVLLMVRPRIKLLPPASQCLSRALA